MRQWCPASAQSRRRRSQMGLSLMLRRHRQGRRSPGRRWRPRGMLGRRRLSHVRRLRSSLRSRGMLISDVMFSGAVFGNVMFSRALLNDAVFVCVALLCSDRSLRAMALRHPGVVRVGRSFPHRSIRRWFVLRHGGRKSRRFGARRHRLRLLLQLRLWRRNGWQSFTLMCPVGLRRVSSVGSHLRRIAGAGTVALWRRARVRLRRMGFERLSPARTGARTGIRITIGISRGIDISLCTRLRLRLLPLLWPRLWPGFCTRRYHRLRAQCRGAPSHAITGCRQDILGVRAIS